MTKKRYTGINIQYPISSLILSGEKSIETRTYPIPEKFINKEMAFIETPGPKGKFKARIVAIITFSKCHKYSNKKEFYADEKKHLVSKDSTWAWKDKNKWGWHISKLEVLKKPIIVTKKKGIIYTNDVTI